LVNVMDKINYAVVIRTFNSEKVLPLTLDELGKQTVPPSEYIFVDSGSTDGTVTLFPAGSKVHRYIGSEFNFAAALNQGLEYVSTDCVLILSSHTTLCRPDAIEYALGLFVADERIGAAYFDNESTGELRYTLIDKINFDGFNGLWNPCSLIRMPLLRRRAFRPEVFASEDTEWAKWLIFSEGKVTAQISGAGMDNYTRNVHLGRHALFKRLNEWVAIAYFVNRKLLTWSYLARVAYRVIKPVPRFMLSERFFNLLLLWRLLGCLFTPPKYKSRYFSSTLSAGRLFPPLNIDVKTILKLVVRGRETRKNPPGSVHGDGSEKSV
jgi:glycosyltransferase involved in cell wall biosynthesis